MDIKVGNQKSNIYNRGPQTEGSIHSNGRSGGVEDRKEGGRPEKIIFEIDMNIWIG